MPIHCLPLPKRWSRPPTTLHARSSLRVGVLPPSLRCAPAPTWKRLMFWLLAPAPHEAAPPQSRLPRVRTDFLAILADIDGPPSETLRVRVAETRSLRELWHIRADVFRVVGLAHGEAQAAHRLASLNRHFPTRAQRPQFTTLMRAAL